MPTGWERVQALFDAVVELPEPERQQRLDEAGGADPSLEAEVRRLLRADAGTGDALADAVDDAVRSLGARERSGQVFGPYRILQELGRGGMGQVFAAERVDGAYQARVAIKFSTGWSGPDAHRRFEAERRVLAQLEHPNIARLLDAGTGADGVPFVVMELVEGRPICAWAEGRSLSERLDVFEQVCAAVDFAHRNLVVHRDLKPANVLVTRDGVPKLLDFGIGKRLDGAEPAVTQSGLAPLTLSYAAPEQVEGGPITVATDVHGLGLLLYELLTGERAFDLADAGPLEAARRIGRVEPAAPSSRFERSSPEHRRLKGDLDVLVAKALRKDPSARYASVGRLLDDLRRHRAGLPIGARPPTLGVRVGKFLARHRAASSAAAVALVTLLASAAALWVQNRQIRAERDRALVARADAEQAADFAIELFRLADPSEASGREVTARELLDRAVGRLRTDEPGESERDGQAPPSSPRISDPATRARMMEVAGRAYQNLGRWEEARRLYEEALEIRRTHFGSDSLEVARSLQRLGALNGSLSENEVGRARLREALALAQGPGPSDPEVAGDALEALGNLESEAGNLEAAEAALRRALARAKDPYALGRRQIALGAVLRRAGAFEEAESLLREGVDRVRRLRGSGHLEVGHALNHLARLLVLTGRPKAALPVAREGHAIREKVFGETHIETGASLGVLAGIWTELGRHERALEARREVQRILGQTLGEAHPYAAAAMYSVGQAQRALGRLEEAQATLGRALERHRKLWGSEHPNTARPLLALGELELELGRLDAARSHLEEAVEIRRARLPEGHWRTARAELGLARCLGQAGERARAAALARRSVQVLEAEFGPEDRRSREAVQVLRAVHKPSDGPRTGGGEP
ncbi:MAG TPA: serine/threonine-protein kinase [Myxococcales bacterium LLY-WYZ-16_1]|nr:serine/threonine-protein kinase [Myxococcales bacterium LLY-WYZ-16_1]